MSDTSPILSLPYLLPSQAQKHVTHNEALRRLDLLVQTAVADRDRTDPPQPATPDHAHIVAPGATGAWAGQDGALAHHDGTAWHFLPPQPGWRAHVTGEGIDVVWDGAAWGPLRPDLNHLDGLGIATAADATNRLAVAAPATLLTHAGAGHQLKLNKAAATDTASLLFQTAWSGRAEMGTAGSDGFTIKVSGDGATWSTGLEIDPDTGKTTLPQGVEIGAPVTGDAIQQDPADITPGRLMRADYGYGPGNLLGVVSDSAGLPTGAVIERGSTADGDYVRFADGTQICTQVIALGDITAAGAGTWSNPYRTNPPVTWTFPQPFADDPVVIGRGVPPVDASASVQRRQCLTTLGRTNPQSVFQVGLIRLGSDTTADLFEIALQAVGRWN